MSAAAVSSSVGATKLIELELVTIVISLEGTSPLICHAWSEKAKKMMLDKQMGKASKGKSKKDPEADYQAAFYRLPNGDYGFPSLAFKAAGVTACTSLGKEFSKVAARQAFHVVFDPEAGELTKLYYPKDTPPRMREDMVRIALDTADIRHRPEFLRWGVKLTIQYNARAISQEQIVNLVNLGGFAVGVGEHRPECDGESGRFQVVSKFSWE